jgi:histidine triad (HIT) family protein
MPIELPRQDPCVMCEGIAGRLTDWVPIFEDELTVSLLPEIQFEVGQSVIIPKRHVPLLTDLTDEESAAIIAVSRRLMKAIVAAFEPLGVFVYQNNGIYSGQATPHYHMHVVPRQPGSEWGVGPPHVGRFPEAGRGPDAPAPGETPDETVERVKRALVPVVARRAAAARIRAYLS